MCDGIDASINTKKTRTCVDDAGADVGAETACARVLLPLVERGEARCCKVDFLRDKRTKILSERKGARREISASSSLFPTDRQTCSSPALGSKRPVLTCASPWEESLSEVCIA